MNEAEWHALASWAELKIDHQFDLEPRDQRYIDGYDDGAWAVLARIREHFLR